MRQCSEEESSVHGRRALRAPLSAVALCLTVGGIRQIEILPEEEAEGRGYLVYALASHPLSRLSPP